MGLISGFQKRRLEQRLHGTPDDAEAYARLATLHHRDGQDAEALRVLAAALTRPLSPDAGQRLLSELDGWSRTERFDLRPAVAELRSRLQAAPAGPHAAELLARLESLALRASALEGSYASVIGGGPAAAVVFGRDVRARALADPRVAALGKRASASDEARALYERTLAEATLEKQAELAEEFDRVHSVQRAREVGSLEEIVPPESMRPWLIRLLAEESARPA